MDHNMDLNEQLKNLNLKGDNHIKMFKLSNVTGEGLDYFRNNLLTLNNRINWNEKRDKDTIFWIDNVYYVKFFNYQLVSPFRSFILHFRWNWSFFDIST